MSRPSLGAVADAVGHSVLVFAFLPALAPVPRWLAFELQNPLNRTDPVVLTYLPVRSAILLLNVFWQGLLPGLAAGVINGALFAMAAVRGDLASRLRAAALGAATGATAAAVMTTIFVAAGLTTTKSLSDPTLLFELVSGLICGAVAAPTATRLLAASEASAHPRSGRAVEPRRAGD